jgi:hypothetical protein
VKPTFFNKIAPPAGICQQDDLSKIGLASSKFLPILIIGEEIGVKS